MLVKFVGGVVAFGQLLLTYFEYAGDNKYELQNCLWLDRLRAILVHEQSKLMKD